MGTITIHRCPICSTMTTPMRPSTCLDCHDVTVRFIRSGRWTETIGWRRYEWGLALPRWWQERAGVDTRNLIRLFADTPLRAGSDAYAAQIAQDLGMRTLDDLARFLQRLQARSILDLTVTLPRALDGDVSGDHGPLCGCQKWTFELRARPPKPLSRRR